MADRRAVLGMRGQDQRLQVISIGMLVARSPDQHVKDTPTDQLLQPVLLFRCEMGVVRLGRTHRVFVHAPMNKAQSGIALVLLQRPPVPEPVPVE
ncbi:hypothetical protein D3C71_1626860 [compost metagenome]